MSAALREVLCRLEQQGLDEPSVDFYEVILDSGTRVVRVFRFFHCLGSVCLLIGVLLVISALASKDLFAMLASAPVGCVPQECVEANLRYLVSRGYTGGIFETLVLSLTFMFTGLFLRWLQPTK